MYFFNPFLQKSKGRLNFLSDAMGVGHVSGQNPNVNHEKLLTISSDQLAITKHYFLTTWFLSMVGIYFDIIEVLYLFIYLFLNKTQCWWIIQQSLIWIISISNETEITICGLHLDIGDRIRRQSLQTRCDWFA